MTREAIILRCKDDSLIIMREGYNNYTMRFRDVCSAVWTFYHINFVPGWFEY